MDFYVVMMVVVGMVSVLGMLASTFDFYLQSYGERKKSARAFLASLALLVLCWLWPLILGAGIFYILRVMIREAR